MTKLTKVIEKIRRHLFVFLRWTIVRLQQVIPRFSLFANREQILFGLYAMVAALLQAALLDYIRIAGSKPDLLLIVAVSAGLCLDQRKALVIAALCGVLNDVFSYSSAGVYTVLMPVWVYGVIHVRRKISTEHYVVRCAIIGTSVVALGMAYRAFLVFQGIFIPAVTSMRIIIAGLLYTVAVAFAILRLIPVFSAEKSIS